MSKKIVMQMRQCRPDEKETEYFWKLFRNAQRCDPRWIGSSLRMVAEELDNTELERHEKLFLLRAWQVLVDDHGGFGRFMGAFDTYVFNMQDPNDDCVAWKPELAQMINDGGLMPVLLEAYQEARQEINRHIQRCEIHPWAHEKTDLQERVMELSDALKQTVQAHKAAIRTGYERIIDLGGDCDAPEVMIAGNPDIRHAEKVLASKMGGAA